MNTLNSENKRTSTLKALILYLLATASFTLALCDDDMDIRQSYPFTVETMPVPNKVSKGETVGIHCELKEEGDYVNTLYIVRYFRFEGGGILKVDNGITFLLNDRCLLENEESRLYYTVQDDKTHNFIVVVKDNSGNSFELESDFNNHNASDSDTAIGYGIVLPVGTYRLVASL